MFTLRTLSLGNSILIVKMLLNIKLSCIRFYKVKFQQYIERTQLDFIFSNILTINIEFPKLKVFNVNNWIALEKLVECTLITLFLVGLMMAG